MLTTLMPEVAQDAPDVELQKPVIQEAGELRANYPSQRPYVIDGLLRRGETMNCIGASKAGKSWLIGGLLLSISNNLPWLGHAVQGGRCLLIDNELHQENLSHRIETIAIALDFATGQGISYAGLDVLCLRGHNVSIARLAEYIDKISAGEYVMIAIDAFYRVLPTGTSENDNTQMMAVFNTVDAYARQTDAAFVLNHHSTKGDQSGKSVTDVGSGAGAISRAADTHLIIRPHECPDYAVLDSVCRSFPPLPSRSIRWQFPLWVLDEATDPTLRASVTAQQRKQTKANAEADALVLNAIPPGKSRTEYAIRKETGFGADRARRALGRLIAGKQIERRSARPKGKPKGRKVTVYHKIQDAK